MARKRRKDRPRTKSGRLSRAYLTIARDTGTPELQIKRQAIVGQDADPTLSVSAPGILHARGILDRDQYSSALTYRKLRSAVYGPPWPGNTTGTEATETSLATVKRALHALERRITRTQRMVVAKVAVFDALPSNTLELTNLLTALDAMLGRRNSTRLTPHAQHA